MSLETEASAAFFAAFFASRFLGLSNALKIRYGNMTICETIIEKKTDKNFDAEEYKHKEKNVEQMVLKMDDI